MPCSSLRLYILVGRRLIAVPDPFRAGRKGVHPQLIFTIGASLLIVAFPVSLI